MRSLSTLPVCLVAMAAIALLLVGQSTEAEETTKETSDETTTESTTETPWPLRQWVSDRDPERTEQILEVLDSDLTSQGLNFEDEPLEGVIAFLREEYSLQIQLDATGLEDLGIGPDEPITISIRDVKLGSAFRFMLRPLELSYAIQDGILLVTSEKESLVRLSIAIYPVEDLLNEKPDWDSLMGAIAATVACESCVEYGGENEKPGWNSLIDMIVSTVACESWAENGGGEAEVWPYPQRSVLVISQTTQVHEQIAALLAALREYRANPHAPYPLSDGSVGGGEGGGGGGGGQF